MGHIWPEIGVYQRPDRIAVHQVRDGNPNSLVDDFVTEPTTVHDFFALQRFGHLLRHQMDFVCITLSESEISCVTVALNIYKESRELRRSIGAPSYLAIVEHSVNSPQLQLGR